MSDIKVINLNRVQVKLSDTDDPVALKTNWEPLKPGGASFKTQKLVEYEHTITIEKTLGAYVIALCFVVPGLLGLFVGAPYNFYMGKVSTGIFLTVWGAMFAAAGVFLFKSDKKFTIDKLSGTYYRGKGFDYLNSHERIVQGNTNDVYAIQILEEKIRSHSNNRRTQTYTSYEINFVFKDGERVNIMDHGKEEDIVRASKILGAFLRAPVWRAEY